MIFQEKKTGSGYEYKVEDVFGVIEIKSDGKLEGDVLDSMVSLLIRQNHSAGTIHGSVQHDHGTVEFTFTRESDWGEVSPEEEREWNEPNQLCKNTRISTDEPESVFTQIRRWIDRISRKLRRSVEVLREVWKNPR